MFSLTRDGFLNHSLMKPFVICHFEMLTFVVSHVICFKLFFLYCKSREARFLDFCGGPQKRETKLG